MINKDLTEDERFLASLESKVRFELDRLRQSGAVDETTPLCTLYAVALDNVRLMYDDLRGSTARNLMKF